VPAGFEQSPRILALGGDLKSTFCLLDGARAIVSQHIGDLENAETHADYQKNVALYRELFRFQPELLAGDLHPDYFSTRLGLEWSHAWHVPLRRVQHHHAHVASCLFEHGRALDAGPVLGIALDGLGVGEDDALLGGEFLHATYEAARRLATFRPVALLGGDRAALEPWRSAYAHLDDAIGIERFLAEHPNLPLATSLRKKPLATLASLVANPRISPRASSVGRLFDAVAATLGLHTECVSFEGQAAMALESLVRADDGAYPFASESGVISPEPMWHALLADLDAQVSPHVIAARFHAGLAAVIVQVALDCARAFTDTVVLGGGVFQNRVLTERVIRDLQSAGLTVLLASELPTNDGGLSLGQAAVTAARHIRNQRNHR
jgi:hydrogenase maturation protein HypF